MLIRFIYITINRIIISAERQEPQNMIILMCIDFVKSSGYFCNFLNNKDTFQKKTKWGCSYQAFTQATFPRTTLGLFDSLTKIDVWIETWKSIHFKIGNIRIDLKYRKNWLNLSYVGN